MMKNDQEFLQEMWAEITTLEQIEEKAYLEYIQRQNTIAKEKSLRYKKTSTIIYLSISIFFTLLICLIFFTDDIVGVVYCISFVTFITGFIIQNKQDNVMKNGGNLV